MATRLSSSQQRGTDAEQHACQWLERHGLSLLTRNWRCRHGELDLIMLDGETIVFVEVRLRKQQHFGGAAASVTAAKQLRLHNSASLFLSDHPELGEQPCRFDVVAATGDHQRYTFNWIKDAFHGD